MQNSEQINKQFYLGKGMLDSERYERAIEIYNELIPQVDANEDDEAKVTLETALNNRGCAKCKEALKNKNLDLYESGIDDFDKAIKVSGITDKHELTMSTAWANHQFALDEFNYLKMNIQKKLKSTDIPKR